MMNNVTLNGDYFSRKLLRIHKSVFYFLFIFEAFGGVPLKQNGALRRPNKFVRLHNPDLQCWDSQHGFIEADEDEFLFERLAHKRKSWLFKLDLTDVCYSEGLRAVQKALFGPRKEESFTTDGCSLFAVDIMQTGNYHSRTDCKCRS